MEISDLVLEPTVKSEEIEAAGLSYGFPWGYDSEVYRDNAGTLYMFDKLDNGEYRHYMTIKPEENY